MSDTASGGVLATISDKMKVSIEAAAVLDDTISVSAFEAVKENIVSAVSNVNIKIATIDDISDTGSVSATQTFSVLGALADQIKTAVEAEATTVGSGSAQVTFSGDDGIANVTAAAVNSAPTDIDLVLVGESEATAEGVAISIVDGAANLTIGTIYVTDDSNEGGAAVSAAGRSDFTYSLAGDDAEKFEIVAGKLALKSSPDFESQSSYSVSIKVKDDGGKSFSESFNLAVDDVDDTVLAGSFRFSTVDSVDASLVDNLVGPNGTASRTTEIDLTVADGVITFSQLELDELNIQESLLESSDKYTSPVIKVAVGTPTTDETHTIKIGIIEGDDATRVIDDERFVEIEFEVSFIGSGDAFSLSNGSAVKVSYAAKGEDAASTTISVGDIDHSTFSYDAALGMLEIRLLDVIDALADQTDSIVVEATAKFSDLIKGSENYYFDIQGLPVLDDSGTPVTNISGPVKIFDINVAPSLTVPSSGSDVYNLIEDNIVEADILFTGLDIDGDDLSYSITNDSGLSVQSLNGTYGTLQIKLSDGSYSYKLATTEAQSISVQSLKESEAVVDEFTVSLSDGSLVDSESLVFKILGANDVPTSLSLDATTVDENVSGAVVGRLSAVDLDGDSLSFSLLEGEDDNALFEVNSENQLQLKSTTSLNYEGVSQHTVTVVVGDGNASITRTFSIQVLDKNDIATGSVAITGVVLEGSTLTAVPTIADEDGLGTLSYQWFADGEQVSGATDQTLVIPTILVDKVLSVKVSFTDRGDNLESITSDATIAVEPTTEAGFALKGPLQGAIAFADYDGDGALTAGEPWVATESDGSYALASNSNLDKTVDYDKSGFNYEDFSIVVSLENATDNTSGESYAGAGTTLKAAPGGGIITPMTTLHEHSEEHATNFASADLAEALGLDRSVDILTLNTHAAGVDADLAHEVEGIQQHLMTTTMLLQSVIKGSGTPEIGAAVSDAVAHDVALDSLINLIIEVHKSNNESGGSDAVSITGALDLSDHAHLEELEELIEADLVDMSEGGFGATMSANGTTVPEPVLEYALEHSSVAIGLINTALDTLVADDFGGITAGAVSHLKHDVADEIQQMATAARAHYDEWVADNPNGTFDEGTANPETGVLEGGDWAGFDADNYLTLNTTSAINAKIIANKAVVAEHFGQTDLTLLLPEVASLTEDAADATASGILKGFGPTGGSLEYSIAGLENGTYGTLVLDASTGEYTYTLNNSATAVDSLRADSSVTETFSVQVTDGLNTTTAQNLSFAIQGVDDQFRIQTDELVDGTLTDYLSGSISKTTDPVSYT
ncbi:MAG: VCBS domain-containing protein, partial [Pseudomonadales bacterium]